MESQAQKVIQVLQKAQPPPPPAQMSVVSSGEASVNQLYKERDPTVIPLGFSLTCATQQWDSEGMWLQLSDQKTPWFEAANGAYIYWNKGDGKWWIDAPDGHGVYIAKAPAGGGPPTSGWQILPGAKGPGPTVQPPQRGEL